MANDDMGNDKEVLQCRGMALLCFIAQGTNHAKKEEDDETRSLGGEAHLGACQLSLSTRWFRAPIV